MGYIPPMSLGAWRTILVRYGEIGIKSPSVRTRFEKRLQTNIETAFMARGIEGAVIREWGRFYVQVSDLPVALGVLTRTFGIVSVSPADEVPADLPSLKAELAERSRSLLKPGQSYAVRARRTGDQPFTSMDIQREVGSAIFVANAEKNLRVDLSHPDVEFFLEVRPDKAFFYQEVFPGPGGLPLGTQGRVTALLEAPESALALWLMMRRGCTVLPLALEPVSPALREALEALSDWVPGLKVTLVPVPDAVQGPEARRRFGLETMRRFTRGRRAHAIVVDDDFRGAARWARLDELAGGFPVFRPLVGFVGGRRERLVRVLGIGPAIASHAAVRQGEAAPVGVVPEDLGELAKEALNQATSFTLEGSTSLGPLGEALH